MGDSIDENFQKGLAAAVLGVWSPTDADLYENLAPVAVVERGSVNEHL